MENNPIEKKQNKINWVARAFLKLKHFLFSTIFPIYKHEFKRFFAMFALFFLITFNYHVLRITKDALIVPLAGAEAIPFLKIWVMLPLAVLMISLFTFLNNEFNKKNVFYIMIGIFLTFFALFILVLYPNRESLQLNFVADFLAQNLPAGLSGFVGIVRYWAFSIFYAMAEGWGLIMLTVLGWGIANDITKICESKRFYVLFHFGMNISGIVAGSYCGLIKNKLEANLLQTTSLTGHLFEGKLWNQTLNLYIFIVLAVGVLAAITYHFLKKSSSNEYSEKPPKSKEKISLKNSIKYIAKSKYLLYITTMVMSYYIVFNIAEILWKSQMKELFPTHSAYAGAMSKVEFYTGMLATLVSLVIAGNIIRRLGWRFTALVTPITMALTGTLFFYFLFLKQHYATANIPMTIMGATPLFLAVFFGATQNCFTRVCKFNLFDSSKEMAFIALGKEARFKGKTVIDGIGSRLGKSGGSILFQSLLIIFGTPIACAPCVLAIIIVVIPVWIRSILKINKDYKIKEEELLGSV